MRLGMCVGAWKILKLCEMISSVCMKWCQICQLRACLLYQHQLQTKWTDINIRTKSQASDCLDYLFGIRQLLSRQKYRQCALLHSGEC